MYYIKIIHKFPCSIEQYYTYEYFTDQNSAKKYYEGIFMPLYYDADLCYMVSKGEAHWNSLGCLTPEEE